MEKLITYANYQQFKQELDIEMHKAVESFVKIGYLLNVAATTDILLESGYANVNEFAKAEYKLEPTQVSRFINIHKRFGVPGEPRLQDQYANHGVAKLGIMLTLPDYVNAEITSDYSKSEINVLKSEIEEEQKISDLEVMMEEKDPVQQSLPEGLKQAVYQLIHDYPSDYLNMYNSITMEDLKEVMAPAGDCSYTIRIPGTGKIIVFAKSEGDIGIINVRTGENTHYEWQQLWDALKEYYVMGGDAKESWENVFKEKFPEEKKEEKVEQKKKESKVKTPKPQPKPQPKPAEPVKEPEKQIDGQDNIMNHPEYLPEDMHDENVLTGEVEDVQTEIAPVQQNKAISGYKAGITNAINLMSDYAKNEEWDELIQKAEDIIWRAKKIKEFKGESE